MARGQTTVGENRVKSSREGNKYLGGTSDATTSSSLIVLSFSLLQTATFVASK